MTFRSWQRRALGLVVSCLIFWGALEAVLRLAPGLVGPPLANWVYTTYGNFHGGIYFHEPVTDMNFQRPSFEASGYFNGYRWRHATDARGFRNPPGAPTGLLLLGDSMIYGHGVAEEDTVAAVLRRRHRRPAYNMGRQGDSLYQHYVLLRVYLDETSPRQVVLFAFANDVDDLLFYRTAEQVETRPEADLDYPRLRERLADPALQRDVPFRQIPYRSRALRLLRGLVHELAVLPPLTPVAHAASPPEVDLDSAQPYVRVLLDDDALARAAGYYRATLGDLATRVRGVGAELFVVQLDVGELLGPGGVAAQDRFRDVLEAATDAAGVPFTDTRDAFSGCDDCFLPGDGHLSPAGHRRLAELLDEWLPSGVSSNSTDGTDPVSAAPSRSNP